MVRTPLAFAFALALGLGGSACKKEGKPEPVVATTTTGTVTSDGVRRIAIEANADGYTPGRIPGKPDEKLMLVFTRTIDASCISELKTPDGKIVQLPMNKPVEVAVTVPKTGEVEFACGMNMYRGTVVAGQ
jgi:plastocyanin domain-containing protein